MATRAATDTDLTSGRGGLPGRLLATRPVRTLLRVPLFWKILVANSLLVGTAVGGACLLLGSDGGRPSAATLTILAGAAAGVSALFNAVTVYLALAPQRALEKTARRVQEGDLEARAPLSPLADADLARLVRVFNQMLDELEASRGQLRRLARRTMETEERIREDVAGMLEDDVAQALASSILEARVAAGGAGGAREDRPDAEGLREALAAALERVRAAARRLRPPELRDLGLDSALRAYVRSAVEAGGGGPRAEVEVDPVEEVLSEEARLALYRILQAGITNAVRHAGAERLSVRVRVGDDRVAADVEDDGGGFDVAEVAGARGNTLGLFGMKERAAHVGGTVEVRSRPGEGSRLRVEIPFDLGGRARSREGRNDPCAADLPGARNSADNESRRPDV